MDVTDIFNLDQIIPNRLYIFFVVQFLGCFRQRKRKEKVFYCVIFNCYQGIIIIQKEIQPFEKEF